MKILLVANHPDDAMAVEQALTSVGHTIATCHDDHGGPCRGVDHLEECPLESSVDLAVIARSPETPRGLDEIGAVCAARHRVGVVELDPRNAADSSLYDLADAAEARLCREYEASVATTLRETSPLTPLGVTVRRHDRDVRVRLELDVRVTPLEMTALADRARAGVRRYDRFARTIDVSVVHGAC
jgi:hypothetical protein